MLRAMGSRPRQSSPQFRRVAAIEAAPEAMKDFLLNVTRYPRYLIAFSLGVINSVVEPLAARRSNPLTAVALVGALVSGALSLGLVLRAMVS
jgi:hypothetical protein